MVCCVITPFVNVDAFKVAEQRIFALKMEETDFCETFVTTYKTTPV
jgi:hypothetical protein